MRNKYTYLELEGFITDYLREKSTIGNPQRLGQWFVDTKDSSGEPFPELFYEPTIKKSIDLYLSKLFKRRRMIYLIAIIVVLLWIGYVSNSNKEKALKQ